jgi:hypothetical protein
MAGFWVRPASLKRVDTPWQPVPGWVEVKPGVWEPENHVPTEWELQAPVVETPEDAIREYIRCQRSLPYFVFHHCYSLHVDDESGIPQWRKFPVYPYLKQFFHDVQTPDNDFVEKSRQMLLSWAWMTVFLWDVTFKANWGNMVLSRKESEVDDGGAVSTHESLLGKIRHLWLALPPYLQAPLSFHYLIVRHTEVNSFVRAESATPTGGRGRAVKRALMDEAAHIPIAETIFKGLRQAAKRGTILTSTPNGKGNLFARIRFQKDTTFRKFSFHWTDHPEKARGLYCSCGWRYQVNGSVDSPAEQFRQHACTNLLKDPPQPPEAHSPWYDHEIRDMTPQGVASELDINYEKSRRGRVFGGFDSARQTVNHQQFVGDIQRGEFPDDYRRRYLRAALQKNKPCVIGWDFGVGDPTSLVFGQVLDEERMHIRWLDAFEQADRSYDFFHSFVMGIWQPLAREITGLDVIHYGDPSGKQRQSDLKSWISNLRTSTPPIVIVHTPKKGSLLEWIDFIHNIIRHGDFEVSSWATGILDALANYHYPEDENGEPIPGKQEPVHDKWSHVCAALRYVYMFRWYFRLMDVDRHAVANAAILAADEPSPRHKQPPVDSRNINYFPHGDERGSS